MRRSHGVERLVLDGFSRDRSPGAETATRRRSNRPQRFDQNALPGHGLEPLHVDHHAMGRHEAGDRGDRHLGCSEEHGEIARDLSFALRIDPVVVALSSGTPLDQLDETLRAAAGGGVGAMFARRRLKGRPRKPRPAGRPPPLPPSRCPTCAGSRWSRPGAS